MEFRRKIVVISGGANRFGQALAEGLTREGARVIIADSDNSALNKIAHRTAAIVIPTDCRNKDEIKLLIDKVINLFGRIDLFISNATIDWLEDLLLPAKEKTLHWHQNVILQMHIARYLLPFMLNRKCGYIVNTIPDNQLLDEFSTPFYSTLKHISLYFAERLATVWNKDGIKVSVICQRTVFAFEKMGVRVPNTHFFRTRKLADSIVDAIRKEEFLIAADKRVNRFGYNLEKNTKRYSVPKVKSGRHSRHALLPLSGSHTKV